MPLFTPEIARANAFKAHEARRSNKEKGQKTTNEPRIDSAYLRKRLRRVRKQVENLSARLDAETDPQAINWIVTALYRLTELERVIAGRPLPGQLKPIQGRPQRPNSEPLR